MGIAKNIQKLASHPSLFGAIIRYSFASAGDDRRAQLKALRRLKAHARIAGAKPDYLLRARAAEAQLHLHCGDPAHARKELFKIFKKCKAREDEVGHQLQLFCRYWISIIDGDPFQADYWSRRVTDLGLKSRGFTTIPAPVEPKDEFDKEFEKIESKLEKEFESALTSSND